jgi:hypothetical protein
MYICIYILYIYRTHGRFEALSKQQRLARDIDARTHALYERQLSLHVAHVPQGDGCAAGLTYADAC